MRESGHRALLTRIPGFRLGSIVPDFMHVVLLGILPIACGCSLFELANENLWGAFEQVTAAKESLALKLKAGFGDFKMWCKKNSVSCSQPCFTPARITRETAYDKVSLKAKARNCMYVAQFLYEVCECNVDNGHSHLRASVLWGFTMMWRILKRNGLHISDEDLAELQKCRDLILLGWTALCTEAVDSGHFNLWRMIPKHHQFDELIARAVSTTVNPSWHWCFSEEDLVGRVVTISRASHPSHIAKTCVSKYAVLVRVTHKKLKRQSANRQMARYGRGVARQG